MVGRGNHLHLQVIYGPRPSWSTIDKWIRRTGISSATTAHAGRTSATPVITDSRATRQTTRELCQQESSRKVAYRPQVPDRRNTLSRKLLRIAQVCLHPVLAEDVNVGHLGRAPSLRAWRLRSLHWKFFSRRSQYQPPSAQSRHRIWKRIPQGHAPGLPMIRHQVLVSIVSVYGQPDGYTFLDTRACNGTSRRSNRRKPLTHVYCPRRWYPHARSVA